MPNNFNPNFDKFAQPMKDAAVSGVRFGADAPITEMDLNEMQLIQYDRLSAYFKFFKPKNGFISLDGVADGLLKLNEDCTTFEISDKWVYINGELFYIDFIEFGVPDEIKSAFMGTEENKIWKVVFCPITKYVGPNDIIRKYGNEHGVAIDNIIIDARYNREISKRSIRGYKILVLSNESELPYGYSIQDVLYICRLSYRAQTNVFCFSSTTADIITLEEPVVRPNLYIKGKDRSHMEKVFTPTQLKEKVKKGDFSNLMLGDTFWITLDGEGELAGRNILMQIVGMNTYNDYSSNYANTLDLVMDRCLCKHRMHSSNNTVGGFEAMELYTYLQTDVWNSIPEAWRNVISPKKVLLENKNGDHSSSWAWKSMNLWLLADIEVFGYQSWSQKGYGSGNFRQYPLFQNGNYIDKSYNYQLHWWWLLQPMDGNTTCWCYCGSNAYSDSTTASYAEGGVVFGFRISGED